MMASFGSAFKELQDEMTRYNELKLQLEQRNILGTDVEYYASKCKSLHAKRQKRERRKVGKRIAVETPRQRARYERNQGKLEYAKAAYIKASNDILAELNEIIENKGIIFGHILLEFASGEREFANFLSDATKDTQYLTLDQENISIRHE
jgi:hypothetical protein